MTNAGTSPHDLLELYATLGEQVRAESASDTALAAVTRVAARAVPGTEYASVTRGRVTSFQTLAPTHPDATVNDRIQYELESGPCVDAVHGAALCNVPRLATDARYPEFGPRVAAETGVASMLSTRLMFDDDDVRASLNLYARHEQAFDANAETVAILMSTYATVEVSKVIARERAFDLERSVATNRTIGMAVGILMTVDQVSQDEASVLLRIASQTGNRKLVLVAADVVSTGALALPHFD